MPRRDPLRRWRRHVPALEAGLAERLLERVDALRAGGEVFPPRGRELRALELTPFSAVRVVILGQDPYHGPGQAHGLAFSVPRGVAPPPSLRNIFKEIGAPAGMSPDLTPWAEQGVLLLNAVLTVAAGQAGSHARLGWQELTDAVVAALARGREGLVFLLWGAQARAKAALVDPGRHLVLEAAHPSPLSAHRGFLGCGHFVRANAWLAARGQAPVDWITST
ncbi:uracil-DNA glycosylase [Desulfocurvus sp.]|uniref:uracil-DNA glycosylase n=1 Tax=Desulfocurvus sp. TaxID=2871698 RepID=UPI0025BAD8B0|nr:uracil-DNA glycosylase [Desulfocurvus sp.]MCK9239146.1 uracil-DNA glycosylase [Desulfocurvus sp.]